MMMMMMMMVMMMAMMMNCLCNEIHMLIDFHWLCTNSLYLYAHNCLASLRANFLQISSPHTLANALSVEELNKVDS